MKQGKQPKASKQSSSFHPFNSCHSPSTHPGIKPPCEQRVEKRTQIAGPVHFVLSQDQIAEAPPKPERSDRIRNFSFFSFVP
jgi:hypothetical protein